MQGGVSTKTQPFSEHLRELQLRAICVVSTLVFAGVFGYLMHDRLFSLVRRPLKAQLYYTTPTGGFNAVIKISLLFGLLVTVPVLIYNVAKFLKPAFKRNIGAAKIIFYSVTLALAGILFAYYVSLPAALHFLANIDPNLQSLITVNEYLNFAFCYLGGFALLFQLPLIILFINRIKPQKPGRMMNYQRYVVLFSFIIAAILTPTPDPMNQTIMAAPLIVLYQFSIILVWLANRRLRKNVAEPAPVDEVPTAEEQPSTATAYPGTAPATPAQNLIMDIQWAQSTTSAASGYNLRDY